eukprot:TRINITY_DN58661_c0_g1_i1.p1 TRINITY_DN58661_c0_g1~~TRINITY_DN58661_c0_g1_i1.p1  ORF type:complete len:279 (-),score=43.41 TRINITY_DN58661_c0_g1_i1:62-898(-)
MEDLGLQHLRPETYVIEKPAAGDLAAEDFRGVPAGQYYLKGNRGAGGSSVSKLRLPEVFDSEYIETQLKNLDAAGTPIKACKSAVDWEAPFLLERDCATQGLSRSGSVDFEIGRSGLVGTPIVSDMYIVQDRNYAGFMRRPQRDVEKESWYPAVLEATERIAEYLRDRGFFGSFANLDFQYCSTQKRVQFLEVNPRRSALQDGHDALAAEFQAPQDLYAFALDYCTFSDAEIRDMQGRATGRLEVLQLTGAAECRHRSMLFVSTTFKDMQLVASHLSR